MSTFLELCAKLTTRSGAIGTAPTSVVSQTGRQAKCVDWIMNAWELIQNLNPDWTFLREDFTSALTINTTTYTDSAFGITRFGEWLGDRDRYRPFTIYDPAIGVADEGEIEEISWELWRTRYDRGVQDAKRPTEYTRAPDKTFRVGAKPDKAYVVRGEYRKTPQVLAANTDEPDMPARFHDIIVWRAIMLIAEHDEAVNALQLAQSKYAEMMAEMQRDLLPHFHIGGSGPLA
jgi:hypothetical protein